MATRGGHDTHTPTGRAAAGPRASDGGFVDLVAAESAADPSGARDEPPDEIAIDAEPDPAARRGGGRRRVLAVVVALATLAALAGAVAALRGDGGDARRDAVRAAADGGGSRTRPARPAGPTASTPDGEAPTGTGAAAGVGEDETGLGAGGDPTGAGRDAAVSEPPPVAPPDASPPPAPADEPASPSTQPGGATTLPAARAQLEATVEPAAVVTTAGTDVTVTLHVRNHGGAPGSYVYDTDGCDPYLAPPPELVCALALRTVDVAANADATVAITVHTAGAAPGDYTVAVGDQQVLVTVR